MSTDLTRLPNPSAALTTPCLPDSLKRLVTMMPAVTVGSAMGWRVPRVVDSEARALAVTTLASYESYLAPADREAVLACIAGLMAHYFVPGMTEGLHKSVALDWADDLASFPLWAVREACRDWRRTNDRKPTPHQIVTRCADEVFEHRKTRDRLKAITKVSGDAPPAEEAKQSNPEFVAKLIAGMVRKMDVDPAVKARSTIKRRPRRPMSREEERRLNRSALETDTMKATIAREEEAAIADAAGEAG